MEEKNWQAAIQTMLDKLVVENELPEQSLYIEENKGRDGVTITSYSVCIYEPNYPLVPNEKHNDVSRNSIVLNIKEAKDRLELLVNTAVFNAVGAPEDVEIKALKSDKVNVHCLLAKDAPSLVPYIRRVTEYAVKNYVSKASSFGCCSFFNECSDAKKCVLDNKLFSKACLYRKNLDAGRIFYGKNKNI